MIIIPGYSSKENTLRPPIIAFRHLAAKRATSTSAIADTPPEAGSTGNLLPPILEAAACYATVGEISDRLRAVFGEYREA